MQNHARHASGPKTAEGKARSSQNALRHGLASSRLIIPGEKAEAFDALLADLMADHRPSTVTETLLVRQLAQHYWLLQRALRLQAQALSAPPGDSPHDLALLLRYQTVNERAFHKALAALGKLKKETVNLATRPAREFVSQPAPPPVSNIEQLIQEYVYAPFPRFSGTPLDPGLEPAPIESATP
jgi:hypothetical protein